MNNAALNALSDQVLTVLRRRPGRFSPVEQLAKKFRCQKSDIVFVIDLLRQTGYDIRADRSGGYAFISSPDLLLAAEIAHGLKTAFVGKTIYAYKSVQSTNGVAAQLAAVKAPDGSIVVAESQTHGRGRLGRNWFSKEQVGIYLSIILYPDIDPVKAPGLSVLTALALADTIAEYDALEVQIKWPNDCLVNSRKVAGILTELSAEVGRVHYVVIGVGINVNHHRRDFPPDIASSATSLRVEFKELIRRVEFLQKFLVAFEKDYRRFLKGGLGPLRKRIIKYSFLLGKKVSLDQRGKTVIGTAVDIDDNGNLVLDTPEGLRPFNSGEVTVVKKH
jgi:BirA family biotin operon repressor/biotin-[acetyl-CoA-carboxylase] ligase